MDERSLTAHRSASLGFDPGNAAIVWLNLFPAPQNQKSECNLPGRKATSTNPYFIRITCERALR
jgi:hypothetical protein